MSDTYVTMYVQEDEDEYATCLTEDNEWIPEYLLDSWYSFRYDQANGDF